MGGSTHAVEIVAGALAVKDTRGSVVEEARRQVGDAEHGGDLQRDSAPK